MVSSFASVAGNKEQTVKTTLKVELLMLTKEDIWTGENCTTGGKS